MTDIMKATELMIGDWVFIAGSKPFKINSIYLTDQFERVQETDDVDAKVESLQPIPLTPEILDKNDFEEDDYYFQYTLYLDGKRAKSRCIVVVPQDDDWSEIDVTVRNGIADINISIQYVHELQHAMRLANIEKEVVL